MHTFDSNMIRVDYDGCTLKNSLSRFCTSNLVGVVRNRSNRLIATEISAVIDPELPVIYVQNDLSKRKIIEYLGGCAIIIQFLSTPRNLN